jgi:Glycosyltransferases, probably involved in cell wall biogenesis
MNSVKKISFIVIAYNEEENIANCVSSILNQNELKNSDFKIIVINDGSVDKTADIINDLSKNSKVIQLVDFEKNMGRGFARYTGIKEADGDYIVFIDADITLPENWLVKAFPHLELYDAVGGIAIPDGDVTYICQKFNLKPKPLPHTTGITGSNVIYKSDVLKKIRINPEIRDGEDTDLNWRLKEAGYKSKLLEDLIVTHKENISFKKSLKRIYSFGMGATKLLKKHKKIRLPDLIFFFFLLLLIINIILLVIGNIILLPLIIIYPVIVGFGHIVRKFYIKKTKLISFILAGFVNSFFMMSYLSGRTVGFFYR